MKQVKISPVPLTITGTGVKPTIAKRKSAVYGDADFDPKKNLMVGQMAFNVDDKVWYYRSKTGIEELVPKSSGASGEKVFFITEEMMTTGHQSSDFDFVIDYRSGTYDLLTVKTPGTYIFLSTAYLPKGLLVAVTSACLDKVISVRSFQGIAYIDSQHAINADDVATMNPTKIYFGYSRHEDINQTPTPQFVLASGFEGFPTGLIMPIFNAYAEPLATP